MNPGDIKQFIEGLNFPISKEDLVKHARESNAPDKVVEFFQNLPMDEIQSPGDIFRALNPLNK